MSPITDLSIDMIEATFENLERQAIAELRHDGFSETQINLERAIDMRYAGEGHELTVASPAPALRASGIKGVRRSFDALHKSMFGHMAPDEPVEVVSYRVRGTGAVSAPSIPKFTPTGAALADALRTHREMRFDSRSVTCPVYQRERLDVGVTVAGPAVLDQFDCTTVVCPDQIATVDDWKNVIITEAAP
jgi:N-methylhydantoinase A